MIPPRIRERSAKRFRPDRTTVDRTALRFARELIARFAVPPRVLRTRGLDYGRPLAFDSGIQIEFAHQSVSASKQARSSKELPLGLRLHQPLMPR